MFGWMTKLDAVLQRFCAVAEWSTWAAEQDEERVRAAIMVREIMISLRAIDRDRRRVFLNEIGLSCGGLDPIYTLD